MRNFILTLPTKVVFGVGASRAIGRHLKGLGKKCLLVTGRSSAEKLGYLKRVTEQLQQQGITWVHFNEVEPNPRHTSVDKGGRLAREEKCDFVLALGGGSAMDAAKGMALVACNEGSVWDYLYRGEAVKCRPFKNALPLVCLPTFAATSSETDCGAVISNEQSKEKCLLFGYALFPRVAIIDPELTVSVGRQATIDGAFDIIAHVIEEYLSSDAVAPLPDRFSESVVASVAEALPRALSNPNDLAARSTLSWCSSVALSGFLSGREGEFPIHAVEHALSAHYDIAHGRGLAILIPGFLRYDAEVIPQKVVQLVQRTLGDFHRRQLDPRDPKVAIEIWESWMKSVGGYGRLRDVGIEASRFDKMVEDVLRLNGSQGELANIRPLKRKDLLNLLNDVA